MQMKILIPCFSFGKAGGQRVLACLANEWHALGHEVLVVVPYESEIPYFPIYTDIAYIDSKGNRVNRKTTTRKWQIPTSKFFKSLVSLANYLRRNSKLFDIVIANYCFTAYPVAFFSKAKLNVYYIQAYEPEMLRVGDSFLRIIWYKFLEFLSWLTYFLPLLKVVNGEIYKNYKNIRSDYVIPPGIDLKNFYAKTNFGPHIFTVGCIGRKQKFKGAEDVGEAVRILHQAGYSIKLEVAFHPINYEKYELVYPDGDKNLANFYRSLDVLVAPGHIQLGAPHYPVIEAMACNVPVITTGYFPATEDNSFIVPIHSPALIAEAVLEIMNMPSLALEKCIAAREAVLSLSWDKVSTRFIDIMEENIKGIS